MTVYPHSLTHPPSHAHSLTKLNGPTFGNEICQTAQDWPVTERNTEKHEMRQMSEAASPCFCDVGLQSQTFANTLITYSQGGGSD